MKGLSTLQVVQKLVIPQTKTHQCRFVDLLGEADVAAPTHFISHRWGTLFTDTCALFTNHLEDADPAATYVWLDIFAVNQHASNAQQQDDLENLHRAIQVASSTLLCMDADGAALTHIWVLNEILVTVDKDTSSLVLVLTGRR